LVGYKHCEDLLKAT
jgi:hypothetical protein